MTARTIDQLRVGDATEISRVVRENDIVGFIGAVGDTNPIHSDPAFAATTPFKAPIAPGIWTAGLISAVIGTRLPGPGSIYVTQELRFLRPVRVGDTITARVEVVEVLRERNRVRLKTTCLNQRGEEVLSGEARVLPPGSSVASSARQPAITALTFWVLQPWAWSALAFSLWMSWTALPSWWGSAPCRREPAPTGI